MGRRRHRHECQVPQGEAAQAAAAGTTWRCPVCEALWVANGVGGFSRDVATSPERDSDGAAGSADRP